MKIGKRANSVSRQDSLLNRCKVLKNLTLNDNGRDVVIKNNIKELSNLANRATTKEGLTCIFCAIGNIAQGETGRKALIRNGTIDTFITLANHEVTESRRGFRDTIQARQEMSQVISGTISNIARSNAGRTKLLENRKVIMNILIVLTAQYNTPEGRECIAGAHASISRSEAGKKALIDNDAINTLNQLAYQENTQLGRACIAEALASISRSEAGRKALINNNAINTLKDLSAQDNTPEGRENIASAIAMLTTSDEGITALLENIKENPNNNILKALTTLAYQHNTEPGRTKIALAISMIATTDAGITALLANIVANSDDNILKVFITLVAEYNLQLERTCTASAKEKVITTLITLAREVNSERGVVDIVEAIEQITLTEAGRTALLANSKENPDDNILNALTTLAEKVKPEYLKVSIKVTRKYCSDNFDREAKLASRVAARSNY